MSHELCDLGASALDEQTNTLLARCKGAELADGEGPDYGDAPIACALGVAARPWPADENGTAQAVVATDVTGMDGWCVAARDTRTADVYANLEPGDSCLHGTGPDHQSQVRCQKRMVSIVTVDADDFNCLIVVDGKNRKIQIAGFGHVFELSRDNGIVLAEEGGAALILKGGNAILKGASVALGEGAKQPVHAGPSLSGAGSTPSLSILVP